MQLQEVAGGVVGVSDESLVTPPTSFYDEASIQMIKGGSQIITAALRRREQLLDSQDTVLQHVGSILV